MRVERVQQALELAPTAALDVDALADAQLDQVQRLGDGGHCVTRHDNNDDQKPPERKRERTNRNHSRKLDGGGRGGANGDEQKRHE